GRGITVNAARGSRNGPRPDIDLAVGYLRGNGRRTGRAFRLAITFRSRATATQAGLRRLEVNLRQLFISLPVVNCVTQDSLDVLQLLFPVLHRSPPPAPRPRARRRSHACPPKQTGSSWPASPGASPSSPGSPPASCAPRSPDPCVACLSGCSHTAKRSSRDS